MCKEYVYYAVFIYFYFYLSNFMIKYRYAYLSKMSADSLWETSLNDGRACFGPQKSPDTDISLQLLIKFCKFYIEINWFEIFFCLLPDFVILKLCYLYELFSFWALKYQHFHITSYFGLSDDAIFKH